jgi:hypothetical protein
VETVTAYFPYKKGKTGGLMKLKTSTKKRGRRRKEIDVRVALPKDYPWKVAQNVYADLMEYLNGKDQVTFENIMRNRDFEGYLNLAEAWGLQSIAPTDVPVLAEARAKYALASLIKKFQFRTDKEIRRQRATEIFFAAEDACHIYNQQGYKTLAEPVTDWGVKVLHYARVFLRRLLGDQLPGHREMLDRSRHGPGATTSTANGNTSLYHKYAEWPYDCTIGAYRYARFAIETDQRWIGALQNSYRSSMGIPMHMPICEKEFWSKVINVVDGNRITFVPKDAQKERTIAIEPTLNLYLQLGVDGYIRKRLKRFGVDLDSQVKNQELARRGSMPNNEERFVTIDLSAASDSVSLKVCELLLPKDWVTYLMDLRSPRGQLGEMVSVEYEKISSMGNGYTFALESAIFAALIYAVMKADGGSFDRNKFAVFGDDLIVPQKYYYKLVEALRLSGFRINLDKTFVYGDVRESCGTDWFQGHPLRPIFLTEQPKTVMDLWCDYNRIKRLLSVYWEVGEESKALTLLGKWIPDKFNKYLGPLSDEDFDSYKHTAIPPQGSYEQCLYKFPRLIVIPRRRKGKDFLFRKLMHDLRGEAIKPNKWERKLRGVGSRFTVTSRNAMTVGETFSVADIWRSEYKAGTDATVYCGLGPIL